MHHRYNHEDVTITGRRN